MRASIIRSVRILAALALIAAITVFFSRFVRVNATTAGFLYLVGILVIATTGGLIESTLASVAAMLCFNYFFLPPVRTFTIADPQNWIALFAFLATSLTASQLSARAQRRTREAVERSGEMERLYSLSRGLLLSDAERPLASEIVQQIARTFDFSGVALFERKKGKTYQAGTDDVPEIDSKMKEAAIRSTVLRDEASLLTIAPIRLGGEPIGSLAVRGASLSDPALQSLLNLVAIALERALSQETVNRAEVARQSEELKSTLLDVIAHEFKTPLTAIKAATTDLLSGPAPALSEDQRELISIADEGADRISKLVTEAIQLARIEGGRFRLNRGLLSLASLVSGALRQMKPLTEGREVQLSLKDNHSEVWVDPALIEVVICHLIDNALKYSPPASPISIAACVDGTKVIISVVDQGPGITQDEQERIFNKFYRGAAVGSLKGTGMGLAIAREIIRAHGEEIWVQSSPGQGSKFSFSLPMAPRSNAK